MAPGQAVVRSEGGKKRLIIDYRGLSWGPDIAQFGQAMKDVLDKLQEFDADEVVLTEYYERIYNEEQTKLLKQIADLISALEADAVWSPSHLGKSTETKVISPRHDAVLKLLNTLHSDPFRAYLSLIQEIKAQVAKAATLEGDASDDLKIYLGTLQFMRQKMEQTDLIRRMKEYLSQLGTIPEGRTAYHAFFESAIKPSFIGSRIFFTGTEGLELVDQYDVVGTKVYIYKHPDKVEMLYYINPPEYSLPPDKYFLLEKTKEVVAQHRPDTVEFMDITQARKYFRKVYVATIADLALKNNISLSVEEKEELATIVARYTIGYGILEILLSDRKITDVYIDSPLGVKPIYLVHGKYGQCQSNIIFSNEEARSIVSRFRALSGRPFDEAHPILDFDLEDLQTRIAVIGKPLALDGIAFALRLHKDTPWTLSQFVDNGMFSAFNAGMFSFFVDAQASMLIVGSRGAGKTSMLQSLMLEIPQNLRILVQEDSVTADSRMVVERDGKLQSTTAGKLVDDLMATYGHEDVAGKHVLRTNPDDVKVYSLHPNGRVVLTPVSQFTRHKTGKDIYEVKTRTGRRIQVTSDHSLFTLDSAANLSPVKPTALEPGQFVAIPSILPAPSHGVGPFNGLPRILANGIGFLSCPRFTGWLRENQDRLRSIAAAFGYSKSAPASWIRKGMVPVRVFNALSEKAAPPVDSLISFKLDERSKPIPSVTPADDDLACFAGLWLADGCYDGKYGVVVSVDSPEENALVGRIAERFGLKVRLHSDGFSKIVSNTGFVWFLKEVLDLKGDAYTKRLPSWAFQLSQNQRFALLGGFLSGDGYVAKNELYATTCSSELAAELQTLFLSFGVVSRTAFIKRDKTFRVAVGNTRFLRALRPLRLLQPGKSEALQRLSGRLTTHDTSDVIPLPAEFKQYLSKEIAINRHDYLTRGNHFGRQKLASLVSGKTVPVALALEQLLSADVFWDEVVSVTRLDLKEENVYDFSVPDAKNFVCENILAHNTQELPVPALKRIGYNIQRLKTRPPLGGGTETEVSAEDALRTALRLGDSVLIVGEVRSGEAKALYEAMRVGAVGNVVMGTIHGESAYSIWDRVVNDLGVPTTSFKATDFCLVGAPIRFKGSLKRHRRVIELTEVLKHWESDPDKEDGLQPWLQFDANKDAMDFFEDQIKERSEWVRKVRLSRGLTYEDIMNEIMARGATKQHLVDQKRKYDIPLLLEAQYAVRAHNKYLLLSEKQREENGAVDHKTLLADWKKWTDDTLVRDLVALKGVK